MTIVICLSILGLVMNGSVPLDMLMSKLRLNSLKLSPVEHQNVDVDLRAARSVECLLKCIIVLRQKLG